MSTRNRIIYQSLALYVGPSPSTGTHNTNNIKQLHGVISANISVDRPTEDVVTFGQLAARDKLTVESPTVNLDFSYYVVDAINDRNIGLSTNSGISALSNILGKTQDDKNYFLAIADEGIDAATASAADLAVLGVGNGFISSYSTEGSVGGFPTANVGVEGLNVRAYADAVSETIPAVDPLTGLEIAENFTLPDPEANEATGQATAIQRGDITVDLANATALFQDLTGLCAQSYNISFDLARESIQCLGSRFDKAKEPTFPIDVTCTLEFLGDDLVAGNLADMLCNDTASDIAIELKQPNCQGTGALALRYDLKNMRFQSQDFSNSVGPAETVSITWVGQIAASGDVTNGLFMSGITSYVSGVGQY